MPCSICTRIQPELSNVANARNIGVSEATIRRHKAHQDRDPYFDVPNEAITSRGRSVRLIDGSWEKITWQPNKVALAETLNYDDLEKSVSNFKPTEYVRNGRVTTKGLNIADLQVGKANQRGGGTKELLARARTSVQRFASDVIRDNPAAIFLADNGDGIENCFNVPAQLVTNDLDVPEQIRVFRRFMIETIKFLAPLVPVIYYVTMPSNHGQHRTGYKTPGGTTDADFGLEISYQIEDAIAENPFLADRVKIVRPEALYETAILDTAGTRLAFNHGHQSGGALKHGDWWKGQDHGRMPGWDADILVTAHFHTDAFYRSGDGRPIISCASSDVGSDWYTNRTGESSLPGMTAFDVLNGEFSNLRLL